MVRAALCLLKGDKILAIAVSRKTDNLWTLSLVNQNGVAQMITTTRRKFEALKLEDLVDVVVEEVSILSPNVSIRLSSGVEILVGLYYDSTTGEDFTMMENLDEI